MMRAEMQRRRVPTGTPASISFSHIATQILSTKRLLRVWLSNHSTMPLLLPAGRSALPARGLEVVLDGNCMTTPRVGFVFVGAFDVNLVTARRDNGV